MRWRGRATLFLAAAIGTIFGGCRERKESPPAPAPGRAKDALKNLEPAMKRDDRFRRGIALGLFASTEDQAKAAAIYRQLLDEICALHATDIELTIEWSMKDVSSVDVMPPRDRADRDAMLDLVIDAAHERKLRVFLLPIVRLEQRSMSEWRGTIRPRDPPTWWRSYRSFILHYADLAAKKSVDLFSVGSELISMESDVESWKALIAETRKHFLGVLTYSANWDHFTELGFWSSLDVVGISAYPPLLPDESTLPDAASLDDGWHPFVDDLRRFAAARNLHYLFTEIGYPSHTEGALRPWDERPRGEPDLQLQLACYRSMFKMFARDDRLDGIFLWNYFGQGGPIDRGYTPRGKPAADVIRYWFETSRELREER
jgi:hypothetical protein